GLLVVDAAAFVEVDLEQRARSDVARNEVSVAGIHPLEEVVALALGDVVRMATILGILRNPNAAALATRALRDEAQLVGAGDGGRVDLDELAVSVDGALPIRRSGGG